MAKIRKNDLRNGLPLASQAAPGSVDLAQWTDEDVLADIKRFLVRYGRVGSKDRNRVCSEATMTARRHRLHKAFMLLASASGVRTLSELKPRHLPLMVETWNKAGIAPRTQVQIFNVVKWFWRIHGLSRTVGSIKDYTQEPDRYVVRAAAQFDRGVSALVDDMPALFKRFDARDERIGAFARLGWSLGLRKLECIRLHPHEDFTGSTLEIRRGAKGGRERSISLLVAGEARAAVAREAIDTLRRITPLGGHAGWPDRSLQQSKWHFEYRMREVGLTKAAIGATFHGLRHDYANDRLEDLSGVASPVRGGHFIDYRILAEHQSLVSRQLGHSRPHITSAYYGSMREMQKLAKARVLRSADMLRPGLEGALEILHRNGLQQLFLTGLRAKGSNNSDDDQFDFAVPAMSKLDAPQFMLLLRELTEHWHRVLSAPVYVSPLIETTGRQASKRADDASRWQMPLYATDPDAIAATGRNHAKPNGNEVPPGLGGAPA